MPQLIILATVIFVALIFIGIVFARLYKRTTKELAFVRTGAGGLKVCVDSGAFVIPLMHEVISVNMNTLRLEVNRSGPDALITRDRMRVDVIAEFYVRVSPNAESIAKAAQTLGSKTLNPSDLRDLVNGKFIDGLRSVGSSMSMEELHEQRSDFVQKVQQSVSEDLAKNGLELESVSLTGLDQTDIKFLNENNSFDAEGLTALTEIVESKKKKRNEIEQTNRVAIAQKNMEAEQQTLTIKREQEYARLEQEREISIRRAEQSAEIAKQDADRTREAQEAQIQAQRSVDLQKIDAEKQVEQQQILKTQQVEQSKIEQEKAIELAKQEKQILISKKSEEESDAKRAADEARVAAVKAEEQVITARQTEIAERDKAVALIEARKQAEQDAVGIQVQADAEKEAAQALADARRIEAEAEKDAEIVRAEGKAKYYAVEAEGQTKLNEALNTLSAEQVAMNLRAKLIDKMPSIIAESVKPMENIDSIKILQMNGHAIGGSVGGTVSNGAGGSLPEQVVNSALNYRMQSPLVDQLMQELGLGSAGNISKMAENLLNTEQPVATAKIEPALEPQVQDTQVQDTQVQTNHNEHVSDNQVIAQMHEQVS